MTINQLRKITVRIVRACDGNALTGILLIVIFSSFFAQIIKNILGESEIVDHVLLGITLLSAVYSWYFTSFCAKFNLHRELVNQRYIQELEKQAQLETKKVEL